MKCESKQSCQWFLWIAPLRDQGRTEALSKCSALSPLCHKHRQREWRSLMAFCLMSNLERHHASVSDPNVSHGYGIEMFLTILHKEASSFFLFFFYSSFMCFVLFLPSKSVHWYMLCAVLCPLCVNDITTVYCMYAAFLAKTELKKRCSSRCDVWLNKSHKNNKYCTVCSLFPHMKVNMSFLSSHMCPFPPAPLWSVWSLTSSSRSWSSSLCIRDSWQAVPH